MAGAQPALARLPRAAMKPRVDAACTVFLSVPAGRHVANLLRGSVLPTLLAECDARIVILSPFVVDPRFTAEFAHPRVAFEALDPHRPAGLERAIDSIVGEKFLRETRLVAARLERDRDRLLAPSLGRRTLAAVKTAAAALPVSRRTWCGLAGAVTPRARYAALIREYGPSLVVTSTAGFLDAETPLIHAARRAGVPVWGVDLGWDSLSSRRRAILPVDRLVVWNEEMRRAAVAYHDLTAARVGLSGAVPFDAFFGRQDLPARDEFLRGLGADPARRLVTLATAPPDVYPTTDRLAGSLAQAVAEDRLGPPAQLLVRVHPRDDLERYRGLAGRPAVLVEQPISRLDGVSGTLPCDLVTPTTRDRVHLAATLARSDVIVTFASTTTIEACVFDTPVVNVGFDAEDGLPLPLSIRRGYACEHYQPVVEAGAARVASSLDDLLAEVRRYLEHPAADRDGRRAIVERVCGFTDAEAGRRVAREIASALEPLASRRPWGP